VLPIGVPLRSAPGEEGGQPLVGVARGHQAVEVDLLDLGQPLPHVAHHRAARGGHRAGQRRRALAGEMLVEPGERRGLRVLEHRVHQARRARLLAPTERPENSRSSANGWLTR